MENKEKQKTPDDYLADLLSLAGSDSQNDYVAFRTGLTKALITDREFATSMGMAFVAAANRDKNVVDELFMIKDVVYENYAEKGKVDELDKLIVDSYYDHTGQNMIVMSRNAPNGIYGTLEELFNRYPVEATNVLGILMGDNHPYITFDRIKEAIENYKIIKKNQPSES